MMVLPVMFADGAQSLSSRPTGTDTLLIFGDATYVLIAAGVLAIVFFLWARYGRRIGKRSKRSHRPAIVTNSLRAQQDRSEDDEDPAGESDDGEEEKDDSSGHRHRKRRRRRDHRPRHPTLAETGGLPPIRPPEDRPPML